MVRSELSDRYTVAFEVMKMEIEDGQTILLGEIIDQPQLFGILDRINRLGLQLLSVQALQDDAYPNIERDRELQVAYGDTEAAPRATGKE